MLLAILRTPSDVSGPARAAAITGLAIADVKHRLQGMFPRVLLLDADGARIQAAARELETAGFAVLTCDPASVPADDDRVVGRRVELGKTGLAVFDGKGERHDCPAAALTLIQRGARLAVTSETVTTKRTRLAPGRALLSGGLVLTKTVTETGTRSSETREPFVVLHRNDGEPDIIIYERRCDWRGLGPDMQPASAANLLVLLSRVHQMAPAAPVDDRVLRPGFVSALPDTSADPVDLGLYLVLLARLHGWSLRSSYT